MNDVNVNRPPETPIPITPETFFPSDPLNQAFRLFLFQYCRFIDGVTVSMNHGRPQLEIPIKTATARRIVTVTLYSGPAAVIVKAATAINERNCPGIMQLILLLMNDQDTPRYRVELKSELLAQFYCETPTSALRTPADFYDLPIRLAEVAVRLEQLE